MRNYVFSLFLGICFITSCPVFAIDFTWQGNVKVNCERTVGDSKSSYQDTISVDIKAGVASSRVMSSGAPGLQSVVLVLDAKTQIYRARSCQILGNGFLCNEVQLDSVAKIVRVLYDWGLEQTNTYVDCAGADTSTFRHARH